MNYKKLLIGFTLFSLAVCIGWNFVRTTPEQQSYISSSSVTFVLSTGDSIATYDGVIAGTAYDALKNVSSQQLFPIEMKQYDFGVFIEKIGDKKNTKDNAWIYYVNGISGDVASDKKIVKAGDVVEWRYEHPQY